MEITPENLFVVIVVAALIVGAVYGLVTLALRISIDPVRENSGISNDYLYWRKKFKAALAANDMHRMEEANYELKLIEKACGIQNDIDIISRVKQMHGIETNKPGNSTDNKMAWGN